MPSTVSHRPQTLKQAKRAYRKSGATVRLSASELALAERRAVLQERADRIREREARRKANLKRKEERNQKERQERQRMGIPSPTKGKMHVGPSQLHLGDFMAMGCKRKRDETLLVDAKIEKGCLQDTDSKNCQVSKTGPAPPRTPLRAVSANPVAEEPTVKIADCNKQDQDFRRPHGNEVGRVGLRSLCSNLQTTGTKQTISQKPLAELEALKTSDGDKKTISDTKAIAMGPPPAPDSLKSCSTPSIARQKPAITPPQHKPLETLDDSWEDYFVSNTQITRELSPLAIKPAPIPATPPDAPSKPPHSIPVPPKDDTASLLSLLSTQDINFADTLTPSLPQAYPTKPIESILAPIPMQDPNYTGIPVQSPPPAASPGDLIESLLAQISTQDLDFSLDLTQAQPVPSSDHHHHHHHHHHQQQRTESSDFDPDLTEEDLQTIALDYELQSSRHQQQNNPPTTKTEDETQLPAAEYDDAFDFSTQELRELGTCCSPI